MHCIFYRCSPRHPQHSVPLLATSSAAFCSGSTSHQPHLRPSSVELRMPSIMTWRAQVLYVVGDVASTGTLCGGSRGEHRYTMCYVVMTWRAPAHDVVDHVASTGTLCAMWWMTWRAPGHYVLDDAASAGTLCPALSAAGDAKLSPGRRWWTAPGVLETRGPHVHFLRRNVVAVACAGRD